MHGQLRTIVLATSLAVFSASESVAETRTMSGEKEEPPPPPSLAVGDTAPDFTLHDQERNEVSLRDFRGKKKVLLAFYVFAFTGG